jgi:4-amino-4-deoxy-L-arabinose transferase-like glycosyltransferase
MGPGSSRLWPLAGKGLLALLLLAAVVYSFALTPVLRYSDEQEYAALATHLIHGPGYSLDGTHLTAARPPGYAFFIAGLFALGGNVIAVRIVQFLLLAGTVWLASRFGPPQYRAMAFPVAMAVLLVCPAEFYLAGTLYPQTLAAFLFLLALRLLLIGQRSIWLNLGTGLVFSALLLTVPTFGPTMLILLFFAWLLKLIHWRDVVLVLIGASLLVGVWTARNAVTFHRFVPIASNSGKNFLIGNCENTIPYGGSGNVDRTHYENEARALGLNEFDEDAYYAHAALTWIRNNPERAAVLYLEKTANFFSIYNAYAPENQREISPWKQIVLGAGYVLLLALLIWRLLSWRRFPLENWEKLFLLAYVLSAFTLAIFLTRIRFRLPFDYLLLAIVVAHLCRWLASRCPALDESKNCL